MKKVILLTAAVLSISTVFAQAPTRSFSAEKFQSKQVNSIEVNAAIKGTPQGEVKAPPSNEAFYLKPVGTYYLGFSQDLGNWNDALICGSYDVWEWQMYTQNTTSYSWTVDDIEVPAADVTATGNYRATYVMEPGYMWSDGYGKLIPKLTTTVGTSTTSYIFGDGAEIGDGFMGMAIPTTKDEPVQITNALIQNAPAGDDFDVAFNGGPYQYGSGISLNGNQCLGFSEDYQGPISTMLVDDVFFPVTSSDVPLASGTNLTVSIKDAATNAEIGTATATPNDVTYIFSNSQGTGFFNILFTFKGLDDFGFEVPKPITINKGQDFYIDITGFQQPGVNCGLFYSYTGFDDGVGATDKGPAHTWMIGSDGHLYGWITGQGQPYFPWRCYIMMTANFQGTSGVSNNFVSQLSKVVRTGDDYKITYPADFTSLKVYSVTGQLVNQYQLPATGETTISGANLTSGAYMLRFDGTKSETVKIVR